MCVPQIPRGFIFNPMSAKVGERGLGGGVGGVLLAAAPMGGSTCGWEHPRVGADRVRSYSREKKKMSLLATPCHQLPVGSRATAPLGTGQEGTHRAGEPSPTLAHPGRLGPSSSGTEPLSIPMVHGARTWLAAALERLRWSRPISVPIPVPGMRRFGGRADFLAPARQ